MSLLHVRQIETHLRDAYASDYWKASLSDEHNLSRLLARYALDLALADHVQDGSTIVEITDSGDDRGIDAISVDPVTAEVTLVQSKWRKDGTGSVDLGSVLKFVRGVRWLLDLGADGSPPGSGETKAAVTKAMETPGGHLRMILATTASHDLAPEVQEPIDELLAILNDVGDENEIAEFSYLAQSAFFNALSKPARTSIDLDLNLLDWGRTAEPVPAYYGRASALVVAQWFVDHGSNLFADNIRVVLPRSEINDGILRTLRSEPDKFWYYNNGITVLAEKIDRSLGGATTRDAAYFKAINASIVNGAQTASTLGKALIAGDTEALDNAYVAVRCIEVAPEGEDLARRITRYANTQNVVSSQDFVFLDEEQHRLQKELRLLGYDYLLRSGEVSSLADRTKVIDVRQAAVALACASPDIGHAVLAKREVSRLFDRDAGPYRALFNPTVNGLLVHRAVDAVRIIDARLTQEARLNEGVRSGVAVHGNRVISHVLLNAIGRSALLDPEFDFETASAELEEEAIALLDSFTASFPANSYPGNVFKNQERCSELLVSAPTAVAPRS